MSDPANSRSDCATLAFVGDLMFGRLVSRELGLRHPEWFWGDMLEELQRADAVFANLECAVTTSDKPWRRTAKTFHFRAHPRCVDVLVAGNVRFVSLANNHALDFEVQGLMDTIRHLDAAGIAHAGAGADALQAAAPALVRAGSLNVAVFAVSDNMPEARATEAAPGVRHVEPDADEPTAVELARARGQADIVVVSAHLGPNMVTEPSPALRRYKRLLVERGADLVHGHSAHVVQGLERLGAGLVMHDTGDCIDDYAVDPSRRNDLSFIFLIEVAKDAIRRVRLVPIRLRLARIERAAPAEAEWVCERMRAASRRFGLELERTDSGLLADFRAAGPHAD